MSVAVARRDVLRGWLTKPTTPAVVRPPHAIPEARFTSLCDGCGLCAPACPETVIQLDAARRPVLDFARGECTFCDACTDVCPTGALDRGNARPWTLTATIAGRCLAVGGVHCRTCGDACPTSVIRFVPRADGRFLPAIAVDLCTGCGACVAPCPVGAVAVAPTPVNQGPISQGVSS
jgi:ferredoxin-type protein NapF